VQDEVTGRDMRVFVNIVDAGSIEEGRTPLNAVDLVPLGEQESGEVRAVLPGNSCDQCFLQVVSPWKMVQIACGSPDGRQNRRI
jgi:hypothetical protein